MAELSVTWDAATLQLLRTAAVERALFRVVKKSGGDALRAMRAEAKRQTRERVRIRAGYLAERALPLTFASGTELGGLVWRMRVSGLPVPLGEYPRRQTRQGVSLEVVKGHRVLLKSAFLATARSGRKSVFLRPSKARYPMGHRLGLSVVDTMADGITANAALERASSVMGSAFARLFPLELMK